ncbi:hypothetical protein ACFL6U_20810 [Planctomycetota bacterium]
MKRRDLLKIGGLALLGFGCQSARTPTADKQAWPQQWVWLRSSKRDKASWQEVCATLSENNIKGLFIEGGDIPTLELVIPIAQTYGIQVHSWFWTMNRPHDKEAWQHPDWFMVSRKGESCYEKQPYVDYYKWVCPSKAPVREHIQAKVEALCQIPGLAGIHLDYIRYPDVILPIALQPKYNLVQDREFPEFDFCYCADCRQQFKQRSGIDITSLEDPTANEAWRQYRYDSITEVVNHLTNIVYSHDKQITAAVFPYPKLARTICRQSWDDWNLDAVFPMIYNYFYNEDTAWIGEATRHGVQDLQGKRPLFAGLFLERMTSAEIAQAKEIALAAGAQGVCFFAYSTLNDEIYQALKE